MAITRPPLTLIQPIGILAAGNPVRTDGQKLIVTQDIDKTEDITLLSGSYDKNKGILTLLFASGKSIQVSGFLTTTSMGRGERGEPGIPGLDGIQGTDGVNGIQGIRGMTGSPGIRGEKGETGEDGRTGDRGEQGADGLQGVPGGSCGSESSTGGTEGSSASHVHAVKDIDAIGILSAQTYLRGDGKWSEIPNQVPLAHSHLLKDVLIEGTGSDKKFLRGDGVWSDLPAVEIPTHRHDIRNIDITGTASSETYLRGDYQWASLSSIKISQHDHDVSEIKAVGQLNSSTFLRGDGVWAKVPAGAISPHTHNLDDLGITGIRSNSAYLRGDGTWNVPAVTTHDHAVTDLVTTGVPQVTSYLEGDGKWSNPLLNVLQAPQASGLLETDVLSLIRVVNSVPTVCQTPLSQIVAFNKSGKMQTLNTAQGDITLRTDTYDIFNLTLTGNVRILVDSTKMGDPPCQYVLRVRQGNAGGYSISWSSMFRFPNNLAPVISTNQNDIEVFLLNIFDFSKIDVAKADGPYRG